MDNQKKPTFRALINVLIICFLGFGIVGATQIAYDGFSLVNYPPGTQIANQGGGLGFEKFSTTTDPHYTSFVNSLAYTDTIGNTLLTETGSITMVSSATGTQVAQRNLTNPVNSGDLYFSYLIQRTQGNFSGIELRFLSGASTLCSVNSTNTNVWATNIIGLGSDNSTSSSALGATTLIIGKISGLGAPAGTGKIEIWLNPTDLNNIAGTAQSIASSEGGTFPQVTAFALALSTGDNALLDEMRFGTNFTSVLNTQNAPNTPAWNTYLSEKAANQTTTIPDFSYAGYDFGRSGIPKVDHPVYDVTNYGAIPNDGLSDRIAVINTIAAAEASGAPAIVFFPVGKFRLLEPEDEDNGSIRISQSNIVIRGSGSGEDGTELFMNDRHDNPLGFDYSTPRLFAFLPGGGNLDTITTVTSGGDRGTRTFTVASTSELSEGQRVYLYMKNSSESVQKRYMDPYKELTDDKPWGLYNEGMKVQEIHEIESIVGNQVTFIAPTKHEIVVADGWSLKTFGHLEGVGVEDLYFKGNWTAPYLHHQGDTADSAWSAVDFGRTAYSWVTRCRFQDWNNAILLNDGVANSILQIEIDGNNGHSGIILRGTHNLAGLAHDTALLTHGPEVSRWSSGVTFWRYKYHQSSEFSGHGSQPYATLIDQMQGGLHPERGASGDTEAQPNHLGYYTMWNFRQTGDFAYKDYPVWKSNNNSYPGFVQPISVGFSSENGSTDLLLTSNGGIPQYKLLESVNQPVQPESLYEAQLSERIESAPSWVESEKTEWTLRDNTKATISYPADQSRIAHTGSITLTANVPTEIASLVTKVDFYNGNQFLGSDTTAPYTWDWTNVPVGTFTVRAKVTRSESTAPTSTYSRFGDPITFYTGQLATTKLNISDVSTAHYNSPHVETNVLDEDISTYWSSDGSKTSLPRKVLMLKFDLGSVKEVNRIDISWHNGDAEQNQFALWLSNDGETWRKVLTRFSSGTTNNYETYYFSGGAARYVRLNPFGSNLAISASITRVRLYAPSAASTNAPPEFLHSFVKKADGEVGQSYISSVAQDAFDPDLHDIIEYSKASGPSWVNISPAGLITGRPSQRGDKTFIVRVTDSHGDTDTMEVRLYIRSGYNDWVQASDGTSPHTIYLWHCDQNNLNEVKNGGDSVNADKVDSSNNQLSPEPLSINANLSAQFASGGKFGWGLHNSGDANNPADSGVIDPSADAAKIFPMGSNPSLTVECWVKFNQLGKRQFLIDKKHEYNDPTGGYRIYIDDNNCLHWRLGDGTSSLNIFATPALSTDVWYHIAGTWNASTHTSSLFVNGVRISSSEFTLSEIKNNSKPLTIANRQVATYAALNGVIDEIKISNKAYNFVPQEDSPWDDWLRNNFNDAERDDQAIVDRFADPDNDGFSNLSEFLLLSDPKNPLSKGEIQALTVTVENHKHSAVTYRRRKGYEYKFKLQRSLDVDTWQDAQTMLQTSLTDHNDGTETIIMREPAPITNTRTFHRLKVE